MQAGSWEKGGGCLFSEMGKIKRRREMPKHGSGRSRRKISFG